jgi:hypothetical protein
VKIDGKLTKDMTLMEAVKNLRGPRGTSVTLTILREESPGPFELTLVREIIDVKSVKSKDLGDGIAYIRVSSFQERTGKDLLKAIEQLGQNGMSAMVLDLRNNPGGLLNQAVHVTDLFLDKGQLIVYTEEPGSPLLGRTRGSDPQGPDSGPGQWWLGQRLGDRRGRAAGLEARGGARDKDLWKGLGSDGYSPERRLRPALDDGQVLHTEGTVDPRRWPSP